MSFDEPELLEQGEFWASADAPYPRNHVVGGIVFRVDEQEARESVRLHAELASHVGDVVRFASWRSDSTIPSGKEDSVLYKFREAGRIGSLGISAESEANPSVQYRVETSYPFVASCDAGQCVTIPLSVRSEQMPPSRKEPSQNFPAE